MNTATSLKVFVLAFLTTVLPSPASAELIWRVASAESQGVSLPLLDALKDSLAARGTTSLPVIRHDRIIYEWYPEGHHQTTLNDVGSMARALVGGVSLAVALTDGRLSLDDPVSKYVPQWRGVPRNSQITVRQLDACSSGIDDASQA